MFHDKLRNPYTEVYQSYTDKSLEREITLAKNIQTTLLNGKYPPIKGAEVRAESIPARLIGGDYYDFYPLPDGRTRIIIGDVMGKGIPAAMLMIMTRGAFRSATQRTAGPGETLSAMNLALYEDLRALGSFVTLFCADWDPETSMLTYANAGHHFPLHINYQKGEILPLPKLPGIMIGGLPNQTYPESKIVLQPSDTVFFYTDGIIEAQNCNKELFGHNRLMSVLAVNAKQPAEVVQWHVLKAIAGFTKEVPQKDDITMVILKIDPTL